MYADGGAGAPGSDLRGLSSPELSHLVHRAADRLAEAQVPSPRVDAELLAAHVLSLTRGALQAAMLTGRSLTADEAERLETLVAERMLRVPLQHLTGTAGFRTVELAVGPGVFIPRPETEQVVQVLLNRLAVHGPDRPRIADLGTGSGAIAAAVAAECPSAEVHAVEVSPEAAAWAASNLAPYGVALHLQDLRDFSGEWQEQFDVVVSNPPYIPDESAPKDREVRDHDPQLALYGGGADGLDLPRDVIAAAARLLRDGGWLIVEHAEVQAQALQKIAGDTGQLSQITTHQDLTGRPRAISAVKVSTGAGMGEYSA